jgi:hypothetical protein
LNQAALYLPRKGGNVLAAACYRRGLADDLHPVLRHYGQQDWTMAEARFWLNGGRLVICYTDTDGLYPVRRHLLVEPGDYLACGEGLFTLTEQHLARWWKLAE